MVVGYREVCSEAFEEKRGRADVSFILSYETSKLILKERERGRAGEKGSAVSPILEVYSCPIFEREGWIV